MAFSVPPGALFPGRGLSEFLNDPTFVPSLSESLASAAMVQPPGPGALALAPGGLVVAEPMPADSWRLVVMDHKMHCDASHCPRRTCEVATVSNLRQFNISVELQDENGVVVREHGEVKLSAAVVYDNGEAISLRQGEQAFAESCQVEALLDRGEVSFALRLGTKVLTATHNRRFCIQISAPELSALRVRTIPMRSVVKLPCTRKDGKHKVDPVCPVTPPIDAGAATSGLAALKEELKEELKKELKEELLAEIKAEIVTGAQAVAAAAARQVVPAVAPLAPLKVMSAKMEGLDLGVDDDPPPGRSLPPDRQLPPSRHESDRLPAQDAQRQCIVAPAAVNAAAAAAVAAANATANEFPRPPSSSRCGGLET